MLGDRELREIKAFIDEYEEGGFFTKLKLKKKKKELLKQISLIEFKKIELYDAKLRKEQRDIQRETKKIDIDIINHTKREDFFKPDKEKSNFNFTKKLASKEWDFPE